MNKVKTEAKKNEGSEKRVKELEMKMAMILEVINSKDSSDMKIGIVKQILEQKEKHETKHSKAYHESESQE